ncbi:MAG TPA: aspartyl protease family protein [Caulobacteraceae bacterium]|nr:aspartyl protease family protein [Caulobacteraceae bacterium]
MASTLGLKAAAAVALALSLGAEPAMAACQIGQIAQLPVTMQGLQPQVPAKINGTEVNFIADSGATFSIIAPEWATRLGLSTSPVPGLVGLGENGPVQLKLAVVKVLTLAGVDIANAQFLVGGTEVGAAGVLGENVLGVADVEYDLASGAIRLMKPQGCGGKPLAYWAGTKPVPSAVIGPQRSRHEIVFDVSVNGRHVWAELDSGSPVSMLSLRTARSVGLQVDETKPTGVAGGLGKRLVRTWVVQASSVKIAGEEIRNTHLMVGDFADPMIEMVLGADFLLSHRVYVANSQGKIWFTYEGGPVFNLGGQTLAQAGASSKPTASPIAATSPAAGSGDSAALIREGSALTARRDFDAAITDLSKAAELDPKSAQARYELARARLGKAVTDQGEAAEARADLDAALKLEPGNLEALLLRAELRAATKDTQGAAQDLEAADKTAGPSSDARLAMARILDSIADLAGAVRQLDLWIRAHPDDAKMSLALNARCRAQALLGTELQGALADCNRALRLLPKSPGFLDSRGLVRLRLGQNDAAIADYDAALAKAPKIAWSLYGRGLAEEAKGEADKAKADLAAAKAADPTIAEKAAKWGIGKAP